MATPPPLPPPPFRADVVGSLLRPDAVHDAERGPRLGLEPGVELTAAAVGRVADRQW